MALFELGCPSLDYVYRMTWAEFRIRLFAYHRQEKKELYRLRELAWITFIAPYQDPKKLKGMTKERFWSLDGEKNSVVTPEMLKRMKEVTEIYHREKKSNE